MRQVNPLALLRLRQTGICEFELPEILYDMDFPGQYMRRIKSVSLSIPCIVGPYTGVNATLTMLENKFRVSAAKATGKNDYPETTDAIDARFTSVNIPVTAIATSSAQNDSGVFELNFKDERYMPFEGAGAISKWRLELPADFRQFDYHTIADVILQIRYMSKNGGDKLKKAATESLMNYLGQVEDLSQQEGLFTLFDLQHDLPNEWYKLTQVPVPAGKDRSIQLNNLGERLPVFTKGRTSTAVDILLFSSSDINGKIQLNGIDFESSVNIKEYHAFAIHNTDISFNNWTLTFADTKTDLKDMIMAVRYILN